MEKDDVFFQAVGLVGDYLEAHQVSAADLPDLIRSVYATLLSLGEPPAVAEPAEPLVPAVPVKKSVTQEHIICLEDGKKLKTLKRHLMAKYGLTIDEYKKKWGLPDDYPSVAPSYSAKRKELAKEIGLGQRRDW